MFRLLAASLLFAITGLGSARAQESPESLADQAFALFQGTSAQRQKALDALVSSGRADAAPILIMALRFSRSTHIAGLVAGLQKLTGADAGDDWADWMRWQEAHPKSA